MRTAIPLYVVVMLGLSATARAQEFEVASVKASDSADAGRLRAQDFAATVMPPGTMPVNNARLSLKDRTFAQLVALAYKVKPGDVTGPSWISELRYNVEAKLPEGASSKDANEMLRRLLVERFGMKIREETKTSGGYALMVAKDGPKLKPGEERTAPLDQEEMQRRMAERMQQRMAQMQKGGGGRGFTSSWHSYSATSAQMADTVARMVNAPVTDETGLKGKYDVEIGLLRPETEDETVEYRMSQALAKLGLKLESKKATVKLLVVESASKTPTEN